MSMNILNDISSVYVNQIARNYPGGKLRPNKVRKAKALGW
jgi:hypothetical protein